MSAPAGRWVKAIAAAVALCLSPSGALAGEPASTAKLNSDVHLHDGIERAEAQALIERLAAGQRSLSDGTAYFDLLSGAPASYSTNEISPRDAFLALDWSDVRFVKRFETGNRFQKGYRLSVMPEGLGQLFWEVTVILGAEGDLERVEMYYRPPAPF